MWWGNKFLAINNSKRKKANFHSSLRQRQMNYLSRRNPSYPLLSCAQMDETVKNVFQLRWVVGSEFSIKTFVFDVNKKEKLFISLNFSFEMMAEVFPMSMFTERSFWWLSTACWGHKDITIWLLRQFQRNSERFFSYLGGFHGWVDKSVVSIDQLSKWYNSGLSTCQVENWQMS